MLKSVGFITAIPQSVHGGSGCFVGIQTLAGALRVLGTSVDMVMPDPRSGGGFKDRWNFNQTLATQDRSRWDLTVGFDFDGYALRQGSSAVPHIANIKGVLGDAVRFERGLVQASMAMQARWEAEHAAQADLVMTISEYCKERLRELYGVNTPIVVVPEMIDLDRWRSLFAGNPFNRTTDEFTVLCVCRFYPRKRVNLLLRAAHLLRDTIPNLRIRIVGGGPEWPALQQLYHDLGLEAVVTWVGEIPRHSLAQEFNRCDIFCLPSVQEGFGIVFLEAMAAGKAIVAARAAAVPEVVRHGLLVEPERAEALAEGIWLLWSRPTLRRKIEEQQTQDVQQYAMSVVARQFVREAECLV